MPDVIALPLTCCILAIGLVALGFLIVWANDSGGNGNA